MLDINELNAESAELLPGREALGKLNLSFVKTTTVTKHVANVAAQNNSFAANFGSFGAEAGSQASQSISIHQ